MNRKKPWHPTDRGKVYQPQDGDSPQDGINQLAKLHKYCIMNDNTHQNKHMDPFLLIGTIGMLLILGAFLLIQTHHLSADDLWYDILNCVGSALLVISAWPAQLWPFIILNAFFALYSLKDVLSADAKRIKVVRRG
jgi:hypothetical protein